MTQAMVVTLGLVIIGQIFYQVGQKAVPVNAPPFAVLAIVYFAAGLLCVGLAWPFGTFGSTVSWRAALAWPTWLIAAAIVAIEVGYLTAYRAGWTLGTAFATASTVTIVTLALIGWLAHGHALSGKQLLGLMCSCLGVWLLSTARPA
jgi:multidrug transporter EmrE-like cation transporter